MHGCELNILESTGELRMKVNRKKLGARQTIIVEHSLNHPQQKWQEKSKVRELHDGK